MSNEQARARAFADQLADLAERGELQALLAALIEPKAVLTRVVSILDAAPDVRDTLVELLIGGLSDRSPRMRFECAHALDRFGDVRCRAPLLKLIDDPVPRVRWMALHALSCDACKEDLFGDDDEVRARIAGRALGDESVQVRRHAAVALGHARGEISIKALRAILERESDSAVLRNAHAALRNCGPEASAH
jgi:HEAT repeat protein